MFSPAFVAYWKRDCHLQPLVWEHRLMGCANRSAWHALGEPGFKFFKKSCLEGGTLCCCSSRYPVKASANCFRAPGKGFLTQSWLPHPLLYL